MYNLRLLQIIDARDIQGNFKNLFPKLRCIRWRRCPWTHMPSTFRPQNLISIDMPYSKFKIFWKGPMPIKQLHNLCCLDLRDCRDLKRLPDQLGDMKALKMIDASCTPIKKLPDSVTQLKELSMLYLRNCNKLRKLPEQIGNMQGLRTFDASCTAIQQLPDSFVGLINLESLHLTYCKNLRNLPNSIWKLKSLIKLDLHRCSKLERLPEQLGKMQCLEQLYASIEEVPDSIGLLSRLRNLLIGSEICHIPSSERLTTLGSSSLERLTLSDEGHIPSSEKSVNLSKLFNLRTLRLNNCTNLGSSLPKLPLNLEWLYISNHISLEQLPDLSSLRKLEHLYIWGCINLQSISLLPYHLQSLHITQCTSLQDLPDLSMLKELRWLRIEKCSNLKSISLKPSSLQAGLTAYLPNREVPEWFNYKSSGPTVSFDIPPSFGSNFLGLALWVVYTCKPTTNLYYSNIRAVITNNTESITGNCPIKVHTLAGEEESSVGCIAGEKISMISGDRIKVSIGSLLYSDEELEDPIGEVKVKMFGVHMVQDGPSTTI